MKVSIVIPTYKRPDLLERLLESINKQTFKNFEVIVVDDNSPNINEYELVIRKYSELFNEFTFFRNNINSGAPFSRNLGILNAKYDLIALVDDDDEWLESKLFEQVKVFENNENVGIVYTWTKVIENGKNLISNYKSEIEGTKNALKGILRECYIPSPSVMLRKKALLKAGLFDITFPSCQDWDMWTRVILLGYECRVVPAFLTIYHKHEQETIGNSPKAILGYKLYYKKHKIHILKILGFEGFIILLKHYYGNLRYSLKMK